MSNFGPKRGSGEKTGRVNPTHFLKRKGGFKRGFKLTR